MASRVLSDAGYLLVLMKGVAPLPVENKRNDVAGVFIVLTTV